MKISFREAAEFLLTHDNYIILIHDRADGDCFGTSCALASALRIIGKTAVIASPGRIPERLGFINTSDVTVLEGKEAYESYVNDSSTIISTDVASDFLLSNLKDCVGSDISLAIDHHRLNTLTCERLLIEENASSAGEVVYELCTVLESIIGKDLFSYDVSFALYSAISSDSGCFKYSNTGVKTHKFAANLLETGIPAHEINYRLFDLKNRVQIEVERMAYSHLEFYADGKLCLIYLPKNELDEIGATNNDTETVVQICRCIEGVEVGVFMYEKEPGMYKFSVRTNGDSDMSQLCGLFGGGGHKKAAGCSLQGDADSVKHTFLEKALEFIS